MKKLAKIITFILRGISLSIRSKLTRDSLKRLSIDTEFRKLEMEIDKYFKK